MAMKLRMVRTLWGVWRMADGPRSLEDAIPALSKLGYDAVECPLVFPLAYGPDKFADLLRAHDMFYVPMFFTSGPVCPARYDIAGHTMDTRDVKDHVQVFKEQAHAAYDAFPDLIKFCNSHTGNDFLLMDEAEHLFGSLLEFQKEQGYTVYHETHRKRWLHSPWVTRDFLPKFPELELVADLSHWINVAETDTTDPELNAVIEMCAPKVKHIHARVGYDHGPQVADPRAAEWMPYTEGHERWWDLIWEAQAEAGVMDETTVTPEHGPPMYQQTIPHTKQPVADIWDVNHFIALRQQERFAQKYGRDKTSSVLPSETQGITFP